MGLTLSCSLKEIHNVTSGQQIISNAFQELVTFRNAIADFTA
jgi:hypothetical protein